MPGDAAGSFECARRFRRPGDMHAPLPAITECRFELFAEVRVIDDQLAEPASASRR